jgi:asparagine synthase (glutamine-hydrolysing)
MSYRGPDERGYYTDDNIMLGHNRLSIIDLKSGQQPMFSEDENIIIVFNGEIYNYKEIRYKLKKKYKFNTNSDTETIIYAYKEYGYSCLSHFNGMFSFALWDKQKKILFIARDRLGKKPLYYSLEKNNFLFSSELKALLLYEEIKRELNYSAINNFLTFRYNSNPETILKNIFKLLPGHYLVFDTKNNEQKPKLEIIKYWDVDFQLYPLKEEKPFNYYTQNTKKLLFEATKKRLISDVPLGALLSGGLDSSAIVAIMSKFENSPKTFTIGFEGEKDNEFSYAKLVADKFNCDHNEITIKPKKLEILPKTIWHMDEPVGDLTTIPAYSIFEEAKKHVTVILMGEGSDEIFAGYEQYRVLNKSQIYRKAIPKVIRKSVIPHFFKILPNEPAFIKLNSYLKNIDSNQYSYMDLMGVFNRFEKEELYSEYGKQKIKDIDSDAKMIKEYFNAKNYFLDNVMKSELKTWLVDDILARSDRMTMAHSMEGRLPFMDHELVEFSAKIPFKYKLVGMNEKFVLKKAMTGILPKEIINRKKQRFFTPIDTWFGKELIDVSAKFLDEENDINKCFNKKYINGLLSYKNKISYRLFLSHNKLTKQYYARQIWCLLTLNMWHKMFIEDVHYGKVLNSV